STVDGSSSMTRKTGRDPFSVTGTSGSGRRDSFGQPDVVVLQLALPYPLLLINPPQVEINRPVAGCPQHAADGGRPRPGVARPHPRPGSRGRSAAYRRTDRERPDEVSDLPQRAAFTHLRAPGRIARHHRVTLVPVPAQLGIEPVQLAHPFAYL